MKERTKINSVFRGVGFSLFIIIMLAGLGLLLAGGIWNQVLVYRELGVVFGRAWIPHFPSIAMQVCGTLAISIPMAILKIKGVVK